jgi:hypothetical protein
LKGGNKNGMRKINNSETTSEKPRFLKNPNAHIRLKNNNRKLIPTPVNLKKLRTTISNGCPTGGKIKSFRILSM